jgi:hypothetical protein
LASILDKEFHNLFKHEIYCDNSEALRAHNHLNQIMGQIHRLADTKEDFPKLDKDHWVVVNDNGMNIHISPSKV